MKQWVAAIVIVLLAVTASAQISPEFFSMHTSDRTPYPTDVGVQFSSWRSLSVAVRWADINTAPGVYDWSELDSWIATLQQYGTSVLFTVFYTPSWASSCPRCTCLTNNVQDGGCYPPNDLNRDGSGSDQHLKKFITALMQHEGAGKIQYLEIWNEPNVSIEYTGTIPQLVRMAQDVRAIAKSYDPSVQITSPAETGDGSFQQGELSMNWLGSYFAAGGGAYVDVIAMHGYVLNPEDIMTRIDAALAQMAQYGQISKPLFLTEGGWTNYTGQFPANQQGGFSFRHHLSILSRPPQRFYLYEFSNPNEGNLWDVELGQLTSAGVAYQLYYTWLVGATMTQPCQAQSFGSAVWTCAFSKSGGYQAEAIWNTVLPWGQTTTVTVPNQYVQYRDLYNNLFPINKHQVPIGYDPIWLEN